MNERRPMLYRERGRASYSPPLFNNLASVQRVGRACDCMSYRSRRCGGAQRWKGGKPFRGKHFDTQTKSSRTTGMCPPHRPLISHHTTKPQGPFSQSSPECASSAASVNNDADAVYLLSSTTRYLAARYMQQSHILPLITHLPSRSFP